VGRRKQGRSRGSPAADGETTWNDRIFPSVPWSSPGAAAPSDFLTTATSTCQTSGVGRYTFTNLLQDVEFWRADPGANFGWILISQDEGTRATARRFASRESGSPPPGPELVLEYVPHPEIDRVELSNQEFRLYFQAYPGQDYTVETSESIHSANWTTLTNIAPFSALRTIAITNSASGYNVSIAFAFENTSRVTGIREANIGISRTPFASRETRLEATRCRPVRGVRLASDTNFQ